MPTDRIAGFRLVTGLASRVPRRGFLLRPEFRGAGGCARLIATQPVCRDVLRIHELGGEYLFFYVRWLRCEFSLCCLRPTRLHYKQVQIRLSDEERRRSWNPAIATRTDLEATGELCFEITTYISEPIRKRWRDGKRKKLEEQLGDLIAGLIKAAAITKEWERVRAEEERQRQELERKRMEQERLRRIDAARWRHICELATLSRQASIVRIFLDELEERAKKTLGELELPPEIRDWFSWARNRADASDPVRRPADKLVAENSLLNEWSYRDR